MESLGFDVVEHGEAKGVFIGTRRGRDGLWFFGDRFTGTTTWSNPENGREFRIEFSGTNRDQLITDNGDGTLTIHSSHLRRAYADGALTGMVRNRILVDHAGTPTDPADDEFLAFLGVDKEAGLRQTEGRDFCVDLVELLGSTRAPELGRPAAGGVLPPSDDATLGAPFVAGLGRRRRVGCVEHEGAQSGR